MTPADRNALEAARRSLGDCVLFRDLEPIDKDALLARARIRGFAAGETIFLMGFPGDSMMAVLSGNVRISVTSAEGMGAAAIFSTRNFFTNLSRAARLDQCWKETR